MSYSVPSATRHALATMSSLCLFAPFSLAHAASPLTRPTLRRGRRCRQLG